MEQAQRHHRDEFAQRGFTVLPSVLAPAEVAALRAVVERDRREHPSSWGTYGQSRDGGAAGESGRFNSADIMATSPDSCGFLLDHPSVMPLLGRLMGPGQLCWTHAGAAVREPVLAPPPRRGDAWPPGSEARAPWPGSSGIHHQLWHRESTGAGFLPTHPLRMDCVQGRFELDDCDSASHCPSVIPESAEDMRRLTYTELRDATGAPADTYQITEDFVAGGMWRNRDFYQRSSRSSSPVAGSVAVDVHCSAGDVIILNNTSIHAGTVRNTPRVRRTLFMTCGHKGRSLARPSSQYFAARLLAEKAHLFDTETEPLPAPMPWAPLLQLPRGGGSVPGKL
jgi:ectoine hydroxylase-related dioxygenase (phytanoyl-CoA dioxygenase family)